VVATGDRDRARRLATDAATLADAATDNADRWPVLTRLAEVMATAGDRDRAEVVARAITDPRARARALARLAQRAATQAEPAIARRLAIEAETLGRSTNTSPTRRAPTVLAGALGAAGDFDRAELHARRAIDPGERVEALTTVARLAAKAGDGGRACRLSADAEAAARTVPSDYSRAAALCNVSTAAATAGDRALASRLANDAEALIRALGADYRWGELPRLANTWATLGEFGRAEAVIRGLTGTWDQMWHLAKLAEVAAAAGERVLARRLASDVETLANTIVGRRTSLDIVTTAKAAAGEFDDAYAVARAIPDLEHRVRALCELAQLAARAGERTLAVQLANDAENAVRVGARLDAPPETLERLVGAILAAGDQDRAEDIARAITDTQHQAGALIRLVQGALAAGRLDHAHQLVTDAQALTRTITKVEVQAGTLDWLAAMLRAGAERHRTETFTHDADCCDLVETTTTLWRRRLAAEALLSGRGRQPPPDLAFVCPAAVTAIADEVLVVESRPVSDMTGTDNHGQCRPAGAGPEVTQ
jgi:hypothetical protein